MQAGDNLAQFEIIRLIGAGGMGEASLARGTILDRGVAVKTLPAEWAEASEQLGRFRREATVLASLNHPSIASIFGLDEAAGRTFLVMKLVLGSLELQVTERDENLIFGRARWAPDGQGIYDLGQDEYGNSGVYLTAFVPGDHWVSERRQVAGFAR